MADNDLSKYSTEELQAMLGKMESSSSEPQGQEHPGLLKSLGQGYLNYAKGALRGMGQAAGDFGASAVNWPISGIEHLSGHKLPHVPHPDLINKNPGSLGESVGQTLGQLTGGLALPGGASMKAAQLAGRGYRALHGAEELPLIGRLLAGSAGGAAEGALGNEDNRKLGAVVGGILGAGGQAGISAINFARSISSRNIANHVVNMLQHQRNHYATEFQNTLNRGEEAGANRFLRAENANLPILRRAGEGKNIYALEKYNANPTLRNAHDAQSDLNRIVRKYSHSPTGTLERDAYEHALRLRNRLLQRISNSLEHANVPELAEHYGNIRREYGQLVGPYLNSPTISKFTAQNPSIRAGKFADKLLEEENFLTRAGQNHPGLMRRERYNSLKSNPVAKGAAFGAAGIATGFLPYEIRKLLGAH